jgi:hypothetical protein
MATTTMVQATWTKLRFGDWGLRIEGENVPAGTTAAVRRRDGTEQIRIVGRTVWSGDGVTVALVENCHHCHRPQADQLRMLRETVIAVCSECLTDDPRYAAFLRPVEQ